MCLCQLRALTFKTSCHLDRPSLHAISSTDPYSSKRDMSSFAGFSWAGWGSSLRACFTAKRGGGALMAIALDWPSAVVTAAALKFKTPVSGVLWLPEIEYPCLTGRVFMDLSGRFADGRLIRTSEVRELIQEGDYTIARTCGRSHHLLVKARGNSFAVLRRLPRVRPFLIGSVH